MQIWIHTFREKCRIGPMILILENWGTVLDRNSTFADLVFLTERIITIIKVIINREHFVSLVSNYVVKHGEVPFVIM